MKSDSESESENIKESYNKRLKHIKDENRKSGQIKLTDIEQLKLSKKSQDVRNHASPHFNLNINNSRQRRTSLKSHTVDDLNLENQKMSENLLEKK